MAENRVDVILFHERASFLYEEPVRSSIFDGRYLEPVLRVSINDPDAVSVGKANPERRVLVYRRQKHLVRQSKKLRTVCALHHTHPHPPQNNFDRPPRKAVLRAPTVQRTHVEYNTCFFFVATTLYQ